MTASQVNLGNIDVEEVYLIRGDRLRAVLIAIEAAKRFTDYDYEQIMGARSAAEVEALRIALAALESE